MTNRILTTHAGSLPRPARLVDLYTRRANGESVDEAALAAEGEAATAQVVALQRTAGVDIPSDGEQMREAFFLYVQRRMSGFGGRWQRPVARELADYPEFAQERRQALANRRAVSNFEPPMAVGPIRYADPAANAAEIRAFKEALAQHKGAFADAFMTAPSPGIVATTMINQHYHSHEAYLTALATALGNEYRAICEAGHVLQVDSPDLAMERHRFFGHLDERLSRAAGIACCSNQRRDWRHSARSRAAARLLGQ